MTYQGYEIIRHAGTTRTGAPLTGWAIRYGDTLLTVAASPELARQHIDDRMRRGIWQDVDRQIVDDIIRNEV